MREPIQKLPFKRFGTTPQSSKLLLRVQTHHSTFDQFHVPTEILHQSIRACA